MENFFVYAYATYAVILYIFWAPVTKNRSLCLLASANLAAPQEYEKGGYGKPDNIKIGTNF